MIKNKFNKGDLVWANLRGYGVVLEAGQKKEDPQLDLVGASKDTASGTLGFVLVAHSKQMRPYNDSWYEVHLSDGRTMMMLGGWIKKVNND